MAQLAGPSITRDMHGNALGGIRTPAVDVPIAALSGLGQTGSILCLLFGSTVPFDTATRTSLYPAITPTPPRSRRRRGGRSGPGSCSAQMPG